MTVGLLVVAFMWGPSVAAVAAFAAAELRHDRKRRRRRRGIPAGPVVLSHVAADGEVLEFPIIRGETVVTLATTLGEIAALPEVAA